MRLFAFGAIAMVVVGIVFIFVFPRALNRQVLVDMDWVKRGSKAYLILTHKEQSVGGEDSDPALEGYEVQSVDPEKGEIISKVFVRHAEDRITQNVFTVCNPDGDIYLFQDVAQVQGAKGFSAAFELDRDGVLKEIQKPELRDFAAVRDPDRQTIALANEFGEAYCFYYLQNRLQAGGCDWGDDLWQPNSAFFEVKPTTNSTRGRIYFATLQNPVSEARGGAGFVTGDRPIPGVDMLSDLSANRYRISDERLRWYQNNLDSIQGEITSCARERYFENLYLIVADESQSIWIHGNELKDGNFVMAVSRSGELLWEHPYPNKNERIHPLEIDVVREDGLTIILARKAWAMAISDQSRSISWQFP